MQRKCEIMCTHSSTVQHFQSKHFICLLIMSQVVFFRALGTQGIEQFCRDGFIIIRKDF